MEGQIIDPSFIPPLHILNALNIQIFRPYSPARIGRALPARDPPLYTPGLALTDGPQPLAGAPAGLAIDVALPVQGDALLVQ